MVVPVGEQTDVAGGGVIERSCSADPPPKPLLRGWLHLVSFVVMVPVAASLVAGAATSSGRAAGLVYATGLLTVLGTSATYHRGRWGEVWRWRLRCADHAAIFVMIAGTYTPLCVLVLGGWLSTALLVVVWSGAAVGAVLSCRRGRRAGLFRSGLYVALGWSVALVMPQLATALDPEQVGLIVAGGLLFTVGAASFAARWPDPLPRHFGYHEVWHVFVVGAIACHLLAVDSIVRAPGVS